MHDRPKATTEAVVSERIGEELVIFDQVSEVAHCLSPEVAAVWESCDGRRSLAEIAQRAELAPAAVERAVDALRERGLVENSSDSQRGYSRREVAARFAKVGAAAFAAPLIYSAAVGPAAGAQSAVGLPTCGNYLGCSNLVVNIGTRSPGTPLSSCPGCGLSQGCNNYLTTTAQSCCYGLCYTTNLCVSQFFCSTQYGCNGASTNPGACPSITSSPSLCNRTINGQLVACTSGINATGPNFGCCGGWCASGNCSTVP
jgi:hypothetical protein